MNLSQAGLVATIRQDIVSRQLSNTASSRGNTFDPTSGAKKSNHETDKQSEDNATWVFEYRALLNSKLTTLTTSLTTAYTTDMDAAMGSKDVIWGSNKNAMQGLTGVKSATNATLIDPGAARSTYSYLATWLNSGSVTIPTAAWGSGDWKGDSASDVADEGASGAMQIASGQSITGTTTFMAGGNPNFLLDELTVNLNNTLQNRYQVDKLSPITGTSDPLLSLAGTEEVGNNFERTLYKFFARPENLDILRFGLFKDVYVVGTSSLPTGSQMQGSLSLNWDTSAGRIKIIQERYACFYHS